MSNPFVLGLAYVGTVILAIAAAITVYNFACKIWERRGVKPIDEADISGAIEGDLRTFVASLNSEKANV